MVSALVKPLRCQCKQRFQRWLGISKRSSRSGVRSAGMVGWIHSGHSRFWCSSSSCRGARTSRCRDLLILRQHRVTVPWDCCRHHSSGRTSVSVYISVFIVIRKDLELSSVAARVTISKWSPSLADCKGMLKGCGCGVGLKWWSQRYLYISVI